MSSGNENENRVTILRKSETPSQHNRVPQTASTESDVTCMAPGSTLFPLTMFPFLLKSIEVCTTHIHIQRENTHTNTQQHVIQEQEKSVFLSSGFCFPFTLSFHTKESALCICFRFLLLRCERETSPNSQHMCVLSVCVLRLQTLCITRDKLWESSMQNAWPFKPARCLFLWIYLYIFNDHTLIIQTTTIAPIHSSHTRIVLNSLFPYLIDNALPHYLTYECGKQITKMQTCEKNEIFECRHDVTRRRKIIPTPHHSCHTCTQQTRSFPHPTLPISSNTMYWHAFECSNMCVADILPSCCLVIRYAEPFSFLTRKTQQLFPHSSLPVLSLLSHTDCKEENQICLSPASVTATRITHCFTNFSFTQHTHRAGHLHSV